MAANNPFNVFRKNQRVWLAALGVMAMISFIVLPILLQLLGGGGGSQGPVTFATSRRYGGVDELRLKNLQDNRALLAQFYSLLLSRTMGENPENPYAFYAFQQFVQEVRQPLPPERLIQNWLLVHYAADQEMVVSDAAVARFLQTLTQGRLTNAMMETILEELELDYRRLSALIKEEMLVRQMDHVFEIGLDVAPPSVRWDWFQRMNRRVTAEVAAISVQPFAERVASPSDKILRKFYEENRERVFDPNLPESGFYAPRMLQMQYLVAEPTQAMMDAVPMEEVEKFYEANKGGMFRKPPPKLNVPGLGTSTGLMTPGFGTGLSPGSSMIPSLPSLPALPTLPSTLRPEPAAPVPTIDTPTSDTVPEANDEAAVLPEETTQPLGEPEAKPEAEKPAENAVPAGDAAENAEEEKSSFLPTPAPVYRPVVFQDPVADEKPAEERAAEEKPTEEKPVEEKSPEAENKDEPIDVAALLYHPLKEVEGDIRRQLVQEKLGEALKKVESKMRDQFQAFNAYMDASGVDPNAKPPVALDMKALAEEHDFDLVETLKPITAHEAITSLSICRDLFAAETVLQLFERGAQQFEPVVIVGQQAQYLLWATEETKEHIPAFEDIRVEVLTRWKEVQARKETLAYAEQFVEKAKTSKEPLATLLAGEKNVRFTETEPFVWKTYGSPLDYLQAQGRPPRLGEVREKGVPEGKAEQENKVIVAPGTSFMETAYGLEVGEVGAAFNQPENVVYLIRVVASTPSSDVLREMFAATSFDQYIYAGYVEAWFKARGDWIKQIEEEAGFEWIRRPTNF